MRRPRVTINARWAARANDAFVASLTQNGVPTKTMASWMIEQGFWPELSIDAAVTKFNAAVRGAKGEKFRTLELLALTCQFGGNQLLTFYAASMGYELREIPDAELDAQLVAGFNDRLQSVERQIGEMADMRGLIAARNAYDEREARPSSGRPMFARADDDDSDGNPLL